MTLEELQDVCLQLSMPKFTAKQMAQWIYGKHVHTIDEMTNLSKANREKLDSLFCVGCMAPVETCQSKDGTVKYLFPTEEGKFVETVYIPDGERATLCVSCQVGCKMNCLFCQTGKQGWQGNLSVRDILNQIYSVDQLVALWQSVDLIQDIGCGEVALKTLFARLTEEAVHLAAHLAGDAQRGAIAIRDKDGLNKLA